MADSSQSADSFPYLGAEHAKDVGRIATDLRLRREFDEAERAA